jgi:L-threonylcarbamoyladenylate synthase
MRRNTKYDCINEWGENDVQCFQRHSRVAWQIMDLSENPTTLVLDNPRNVVLT